MRCSHSPVFPFTFSQKTSHKFTAIDTMIKTYKEKQIEHSQYTEKCTALNVSYF